MKQLRLPSCREKWARMAVELAVTAVCFLLMLHRIRYGIDFTDESWYVAEPYIAAKGAHPYSEIWEQAPGFVFPLVFVYRLFLMINGGTEGIFLFSRCLYLVWLLVVVLAIWRSVRRIPLPLVLPLFLPCIGPLYDINYNTIGYAYLPLVASLLFLAEREERREFPRGLIGGVIIARAIIGTPLVALPCVMMAVFLLLQKRWTSLKGYVLGGVSFAVVVVLYCSIPAGGLQVLVDGLQYYLTDGGYFQIPKKYVLPDALILQLRYQWQFGACCLGCAGCRLLFRGKPQLYRPFILVGLGFSACYGIVLGFRTGNAEHFIRYTWYIGTLLFAFLPDFRSSRSSGYVMIAVMHWAQYLVSSLTNVYGFSGRSYILFFASVSSLWALYEDLPSTLSLKRLGSLEKLRFPLRLCVTAVLVCSTLCMLLRINYRHVYRDEPMAALTEQLDSGVWKGCYTTPEHADAARFLESTIRDMTGPGDQVLFCEWVSFAYLMSDGEAFTPSTLNNIPFAHGINEPAIMYDYFEMRQDIPDKIIYVDYYWDQILSIEDETWKFNRFVEENYTFVRQEQCGDARVLLYERK